MRDRFIQRLCALADADPRVTLVTGDLGFGVLDEFRRRFPRQFINAGIAEQNMTGIAVGLALEGRTVFTYSIGNFPTLRCLEQIRNDACYHAANVKIVAVGGGFSYGALGVSHHATEDLAIMRSLPGVTVVAPGGLWEAAEAAEAAARTPGVCYVRLDKSAGADHPRCGTERFELGKARVIREGGDCTLVTTGGILGEALAAADLLESQQISARVISVHTLKPFDAQTVLQACRETGAVVTIEEHTLSGGLGSLVAETLLDHGTMPQRFRRLGLGSGFCSLVGGQEYLRRACGLDARSIAEAARGLLAHRK